MDEAFTHSLKPVQSYVDSSLTVLEHHMHRPRTYTRHPKLRMRTKLVQGVGGANYHTNLHMHTQWTCILVHGRFSDHVV